MGLLMAVSCRDGIVMAADTRVVTETKRGNHPLLKDVAKRIVPFPNRTVVGWMMKPSDETKISPSMVPNFLRTVRDRVGDKCKVTDLPVLLLTSFMKVYPDLDCTFFVGGIGPDAVQYLYRVDTHVPGRIELACAGDFCEEIAKGTGEAIVMAMREEAYLTTMGPMDAADFCASCIDAAIMSYRFAQNSTVGGNTVIYSVNRWPGENGWVRGGRFVPEPGIVNGPFGWPGGDEAEVIAEAVTEDLDLEFEDVFARDESGSDGEKPSDG